jgi:protein tyrosine phosphatase (PTP) superfamily phosphohydrolase (DUF442 family)
MYFNIMEQLHNIPNFFKYSDTLSAGGQPTSEQFELLKESGVEVIINISPVSARNAHLGEHEIVEKLNMDYIHFPIDCSNLRSIHYLTIRSLLNAAEGKRVFMHCGANIKTSNLVHMYHVLEKGADEASSLQTLLRIQQPEAKWFAYFKKMGMQGYGAVTMA